MVVHDAALWVLLGVCGAAGIVERVRAVAGRRLGAGAWRRAPLHSAGVVLEAAVMGFGIGLAVASVVFLVAALMVQLGLGGG